MILKDQRELFEIPADITFLNCSNMSPQLKGVTAAGRAAIDRKITPWKIKSDDWFTQPEQLRELFAKVISADKENIALIPAVSYGLACAARNVKIEKGQQVLLLDQQFPSNVYVWREVAAQKGAEIITVSRRPGEQWTALILDRITDQTAVVAIPLCHWTDGSIIDLPAVSRKAKSVGAALVIDASQSVGAFPIDVKAIDPDFLVTVGYKWLMGPYATGYLYASSSYTQTGIPLEYSWLNKSGSEDFSKLVDYSEGFRPGARRFDSGEYSSFIHIPMAIAGLEQILAWGVSNIQETISALTDLIDQHARSINLATEPRTNRVGHMMGISFDAAQLKQLQKLFAEHKVFVSFRGNSLRLSPHLYNSASDVEKLFSIIKRL